MSQKSVRSLLRCWKQQFLPAGQPLWVPSLHLLEDSVARAIVVHLAVVAPFQSQRGHCEMKQYSTAVQLGVDAPLQSLYGHGVTRQYSLIAALWPEMLLVAVCCVFGNFAVGALVGCMAPQFHNILASSSLPTFSPCSHSSRIMALAKSAVLLEDRYEVSDNMSDLPILAYKGDRLFRHCQSILDRLCNRYLTYSFCT